MRLCRQDRAADERASLFWRPAFSRRLPIVPVLSSEASIPFPGAVRREATSRSPELSPSSMPPLRLQGGLFPLSYIVCLVTVPNR